MTRGRGFTFIGVMVFLVILGIASMAVLTSAEFFSRRAAEADLLRIGEEYNRAFLSYNMRSPAGTPRFPQKLEDLLRDPRFPNTVRHLRRIYPDPLTGKTEWGLIKAPEGGIGGVYSLAPGQPIRQINILESTDGAQSSTVAPTANSYADWPFGYYTATHQASPAQSAPASGASATFKL